jgi:hypothetical protein
VQQGLFAWATLFGRETSSEAREEDAAVSVIGFQMVV